MADNKYYKPKNHGPLSEVPLDRRYCMLQGAYLLCPTLRFYEAGPYCALHKEDLLKSAKQSLTGLMGSSAPLEIPFRCDECRDSDNFVQLVVVKVEGALDPTEDLKEKIQEEIKKDAE